MKNMPHSKQCLLAMALCCLSAAAAFAAPTSIIIPGISQPVVDGATQPSNGAWDNMIPNALADYFTYAPYSNADAVKLGFPASCGNPKLLVPNADPNIPPAALPGDELSTDDCYTITAKGFQQALSLAGIGTFTGQGLVGANNTPLSTRAWGYGSGGNNWTPPGAPTGTTVTGNAPRAFANFAFADGTNGIWHFPAPTIKGTFGRSVRVQWLNELPNVAPTGLDPSVDCGPNAPNCYPYNRIVTHVHGAHVGPESDGLASAWFTPGFVTVGEDFVFTPPSYGPNGTYVYPMDQEASTIWYHDHAMGTTHNNTNMGMAGFFPITDDNEKSLETCAGAPPTTTCKAILPTGAQELGFALQDRHFDYATGDMVMPDYPLYDLMSPGCTLDVNGLPNPKNCALVPYMKAADGHLIPYVAGDPLLLNANNVGPPAAPFGGTSATLEYFGNIPVVNGVVYGNYGVEPRIYRMRFIGGTDSRTWVMKLVYTDPVTALPVVVPFWQIGSEQGLLNNPLQRNEIDLMPGERVDVLVDFKGIPAGTKVMMKNLGGDAPWPGYFDYKAGLVPPSVEIPEIMAFNVGTLTTPETIVDPSTLPYLRPLHNPVPPNGAPTPTAPIPRVVSLMEITDAYGRTMPTIDSRGFKPVGVPVTEIIKLNQYEQWDIVNTTVDAHPMHLHQVAFKVIDRQLIDLKGFVPPTDNIITQVFTPPTYTVAPGSLPILPDPWDDGWKDTVATPPGYVTRVWAKFDIPGEYVWHCHILSHEEHDMMRNFIVTDQFFTAPAPASITISPVTATGLYTVNVVGTAIPGVIYNIEEATDSAFTNPVPVQNTVAPSFTPAAKLPGTYHYRVMATPPAASGFDPSPWRNAAKPVDILATPTMLTAAGVLVPGAKNKLDTADVILTWVDNSLIPDETSFTLERSTDKKFTAGTVTSLTVPANTTTYTDIDPAVMSNTTYSYRIKAVTANGASAYSLPATIKTP